MSESKQETSGPEALVFLALWVCGFFAEAWLVATLWRWFLVPLGIPAIGNAHALGLSVLVSFIAKSPNAAVQDGEWQHRLGREFLWCVSCLIFGYVAHHVMIS